MDRIWKGLAEFDANGDNKVSIDEWIAMWSAVVLKAKPADDWQNAYIDYMFTLLDASGDDKIDKNEYIQVMKLYGVGMKEACQAFDKFSQFELDVDKFRGLWHDYFYSTDRSLPGNYLFAGIQ